MRAKKTAILCIALSIVIGIAVRAQAPTKPDPVAPVPFGERFPAGTFRNLNTDVGPESIDLGNSIGKKPVLLYYWIAGNPRADEVFQQVQALVDEIGPDKLALFGVVYPQPGRGADVIRGRMQELGVHVPVLDDEGFKVGQRVRVQSVPNLTIIDAAGTLRLTNGASLLQVLEYRFNLEQGIRRLAEKGTIGSFGFLARYLPVTELIGKECPDFRAPLVSTKVERRLHSLLKGEQLNVLIFWSVDCAHCRKSLPEWNTWLKEHSEGINVVSAAKVTNDASVTKTKDFCDDNGFVFPTLMDQDLNISKLFNVTATPTVLIIGPDRIVDSVLPVGIADFGRRIYKKKLELLKRTNS